MSDQGTAAPPRARPGQARACPAARRRAARARRRPPGPPARARARARRPRSAIRLGSPRPRLRLVSLGADPGHAGLRRTAAPGAGRRRQRVRRQGRARTATSATRWPPSAARSPTATASPWPPASTRTTSPPTPRCSRPRSSKAPRRAPSRPPRSSPRSSARTQAELAEEAADPEDPLRRARPPADPAGLEPDQGPQVRLRRQGRGRRRRPRRQRPRRRLPASRSSKRVYPNGDLAAGILGCVNAEGKGGGGLESAARTGSWPARTARSATPSPAAARCPPPAPARPPPCPAPTSS